MLVNTATGLSDIGVNCCIIVKNQAAPYLNEVSAKVDVKALSQKTHLADAIREFKPDVMVSAKLEDDVRLIDAIACLEEKPKAFFRVGNPIAHRVSERGGTWWGRRRELRRLRNLYQKPDGIIAVSNGIADDIVNGLRVDRGAVEVLPNPTVTETLFTRAKEKPDHDWFLDDNVPVICAVGALRSQKDYPTLLRAFSRVQKKHRSRLVIFGEGRQRKRLIKLANSLGVSDRVDLPGWVDNVHKYMSRATVFALSSRWEGSPNALVEAAALGVPVVATDCISGPREILADGDYGKLTPVGDVDSYANALIDVLENPPRPSVTSKAAESYTIRESSRRYYQYFLKALAED